MQKDNQPIIEIKNVSKFFGEKVALDNVNLSVRKGEFVTIWDLPVAERRRCFV